MSDSKEGDAVVEADLEIERLADIIKRFRQAAITDNCDGSDGEELSAMLKETAAEFGGKP